ncbi:MAG: hypothetical protein L3J39_13665 [Verrucomicrobiales bacterium]|nr:hypothetical protein [Verrucomicrobiales bacterium]
MKLLHSILAATFVAHTALAAADEPSDIVRKSILYAYGVKDLKVGDIFHPHDDLWMIPHKFDEESVKAVKAMDITVDGDSVFTRTVGRALIYTEISKGKVAPEFYLKGIYSQHERVILEFLYAALLRDKDEIAKFTSDADKITFDDTPKAAWGDMDVYIGVLQTIPVVRTSDAKADAKEKSVTYRIPLGKKGTEITLRRFDGSWKIDSSKGLFVPMEFFWR